MTCDSISGAHAQGVAAVYRGRKFPTSVAGFPASAKTVLALEALLQDDKAALVLSPTLTIRDQWRHRLLSDLFLA